MKRMFGVALCVLALEAPVLAIKAKAASLRRDRSLLSDRSHRQEASDRLRGLRRPGNHRTIRRPEARMQRRHHLARTCRRTVAADAQEKGDGRPVSGVAVSVLLTSTF